MKSIKRWENQIKTLAILLILVQVVLVTGLAYSESFVFHKSLNGSIRSLSASLRVPLSSDDDYIRQQRLLELQETYIDGDENKYLQILAQVDEERTSMRREVDDEMALRSIAAIRLVELCNENDISVQEFVKFCKANKIIDEKLVKLIRQTLEYKGYRSYPEGWNAEMFGRLTVDVLYALSSRLQSENISLRKRVFSDGLTGLKSRAYFDEKMPQLLRLAQKKNVPVSMIIIDADKFKGINDEYGHDVGDLVLKYIARYILRSSDAIAHAIRLGGEEFVVILPGASLEGAQKVAERIREAVYIDIDPSTQGTVVHIGKREVRLKRPISVSLGVASLEAGSIGHYDEIGDAILSLYQRADFALYLAKSSGRNRVETDESLRNFMAEVEDMVKSQGNKAGSLQLDAPDIFRDNIDKLCKIVNAERGYFSSKIRLEPVSGSSINVVFSTSELAMEKEKGEASGERLASGETVGMNTMPSIANAEFIVPADLLFDKDSLSLIDALKRLTTTNSGIGNSWTAQEILKESTAYNTITPPMAWKRLDRLAKMPDSGVKPFTGKRVKPGNHLRDIATYRYSEPSEFIFWNGLPEWKLYRSEAFTKDGDRTLIRYLLGEEKKVKAVMPEFAVGELLEVYKIINSKQRTWRVSDIFGELRNRGGGKFIDNEAVLRNGLHWLELKGFPILRFRDKWFVSGVNRRVFNTGLEELLKHRGKTSEDAIANRMLFVIDSIGLLWDEVDRMAKYMSGSSISLYHLYLSLLKGKSVMGDHLDYGLEILSRITGREPIWFRTGFSRSEWEIELLKKLPEMNMGGRIKALRELEGISQKTLAKRLNWSTGRIKQLESFKYEIPPHGYQLVPNQNDWPDLANQLGLEDAFYLFTGLSKDETLEEFLVGDCIRMCRLNEGMKQPEVAKAIGVTTTTIVMWEKDNYLPQPIFRQGLADLFGVEEEKLFKVTSSAKRLASNQGARSIGILENGTVAKIQNTVADSNEPRRVEVIDIPDHANPNFIGSFYIWYGEKGELEKAETYAQQEGAKPILMMPYEELANNGNPTFEQAAEHFADQFGPLIFQKGKVRASTRAVGVALQRLNLANITVLDAGTGGGELASILAMSGANVIAVDNNPDVIEVARYNAQLNGLEDNIVFYCNNAEDLKPDITGPVKLLVMNFPPKQTGAILDSLLDNYPMIEDVVFSGGIIEGTELPYDAQVALEKHGFTVTKQFLAGTVMDMRVWTAYIAQKTEMLVSMADSNEASTAASLASNQGANPIEVLESGAALYKVQLPGSERQVEICLDPDTVKLMQDLPAGVTINIFGNQAIQMILGREGVIAKTGKLDEGDFDCYIENKSTQMVDDAIGRAIRMRHPGHGFQQGITKNIFDYLTSGPFTLNALVVKLVSIGNSMFIIDFGDYMDGKAYYDLINKRVSMENNQIGEIQLTQYPSNMAIQGLIYSARYRMHLEPEAVTFIKACLNRVNQPVDTFIYSPIYERLRKLFLYAKDPGEIVELLYDLVEMKDLWIRHIIIFTLKESNALDRALESPALSDKLRNLILEEIAKESSEGIIKAAGKNRSAL